MLPRLQPKARQHAARRVARAVWSLGALSCVGAALACSAPLSEPRSSIVQILCDGRPCCNAFELGTARGPRLVTAAHCVHGAPVEYLAYGAHVPSWAAVASNDPVADRAELVPAEPLPALERGPVPLCGVLWAVSGWASWSATAGQGAGTGGDFFLSSLNVTPGWSGSPVLDVHGRAVGVLVRCEGLDDRPGRKACVPHSGIFVSLP